MTLEADGAEVRVRRVEDDPAQRAEDIKGLRRIWSDTEGGGTDELLEERRRERELEEHKAQRQDVGRPR